jgi:hypothetical protein
MAGGTPTPRARRTIDIPFAALNQPFDLLERQLQQSTVPEMVHN